MEGVRHLTSLGDAELIETLSRLAKAERHGIAMLVASLAEFDRRRLYRGLGYSSLFEYCRRALHLSEQAAYTRIETARAARRFPIILDRIADASLSLTAARLLAPHLKEDNWETLIGKASHKSTRDVERLVAAIRPQPIAGTVVRKLPAGDAAAGLRLPDPQVRQMLSPPVPAARRPVLKPTSETHYRLHVTLTASAHDKLREAQRLVRHAIPNGDPGAIVERALDLLLLGLRRKKFGDTARPRAAVMTASGRHIPRAVQRGVWARDKGRCAFVGANGRRCEAVEFLEYHHVKPYARGGAASLQNIELRCRTHNAYEAELDGLTNRPNKPRAPRSSAQGRGA